MELSSDKLVEKIDLEKSTFRTWKQVILLKWLQFRRWWINILAKH